MATRKDLDLRGRRVELEAPRHVRLLPVKNRRDAALVDFFKQSGVPETQIVYLQDKQATQQRIDSVFTAELKKLRSDDLLIVYYCGHGSKSEDGNDVYLASYDAGDDGVLGWSINSIPEKITSESRCARVLWLLDCCYSSQAALALTTQKGRPAYACVTSSSASESSTRALDFLGRAPRHPARSRLRRPQSRRLRHARGVRRPH